MNAWLKVKKSDGRKGEEESGKLVTWTKTQKK